jgi:antitoxin component of MazEF toxin-antitoxin module
MKTQSKVVTTGHSLAVVVPADFAHQLGIRAGDQVKLQFDYAKNQITYTFINTRQLPLV